MAAAVIFQGAVLTGVLRVVDRGAGQVPRIIVETQEQPDAMGGKGWAVMSQIPAETLEALLIAAHVVV